MERASAVRMAAVKPHGWVHAALGMGDARLCGDNLNNYKNICLFDLFLINVKGDWILRFYHLP